MPGTVSLYGQLSDSELFNLTKQDNMQAFEALYQRHWPGLVDAAYKRLQSRQKSEDIVQEIFINLYEKREFLEIIISIKAYMHQALKFKVLNEFRAEGIRSAYATSFFLNNVCKNDFAPYLEVKELNREIEKTLENLPEKCRQVFLLSRKENLSNKEIANELKISVSTVEKHIGKALKALKDHLNAYAAS